MSQHVSAGNQTRILNKSNDCSQLLSHLSSPQISSLKAEHFLQFVAEGKSERVQMCEISYKISLSQMEKIPGGEYEEPTKEWFSTKILQRNGNFNSIITRHLIWVGVNLIFLQSFQLRTEPHRYCDLSIWITKHKTCPSSTCTIAYRDWVKIGKTVLV